MYAFDRALEQQEAESESDSEEEEEEEEDDEVRKRSLHQGGSGRRFILKELPVCAGRRAEGVCGRRRRGGERPERLRGESWKVLEGPGRSRLVWRTLLTTLFFRI